MGHAEQIIANPAHSRRRPMKLTVTPQILSAIAAIAITTCLTIASSAPVVTVASLVSGQIA
jgi:type III secretory pathway component EscU